MTIAVDLGHKATKQTNSLNGVHPDQIGLPTYIYLQENLSSKSNTRTYYRSILLIIKG